MHRSVLNDGTVSPYFEVPFLRIDDYVEIFVGFVRFDQQMAEHVFKHTDHGTLVDVFQLLEFCKRAHEVEIVHSLY